MSGTVLPHARWRAIAPASEGSSIRENDEFAPLCHFTKREWALVSAFMTGNGQHERTRRIRQVIVDLSVLVAIGIVLGLLAPLGTGYMSLANRIAYWVIWLWRDTCSTSRSGRSW